MGFSLAHLVEAALLFANAMAILNEKRFLRQFGLDQAMVGGNATSLQNQVATFLHAMRTFMKYPLILGNLVFILLECVFF
ncbi:unnamed protein product [Amoebophrya sp. A120]|nr:unnamed protein product [Amoebophrya sp. A120]CAD7932756.1 unnamed protein product [Amoebophrya sp. A120]|eukprot:GSA120T00016013001.1